MISRLLHYSILFLLVFVIGQEAVMANVNQLKFSLITKGDNGPVMLVVGGIQGDEPGGFNAASLLATHYEISHGQLWVVPNLNFPSIIRRSRGIHGDMNRKFLALKKQDPEYEAVQKIKSIINDRQVSLVLNLHDGSGFYSPRHVDKLRNPKRWGQSIIIDRAIIEANQYNRLDTIASEISSKVNAGLEDPHHFHVKNTRTHLGDKEMEKTLTYFAIRHNKPAFGIEASKSFNTHERVYFHLKVVEAFMDKMGIKYRRKFNLEQQQVKEVIDNNIKLAFYDRKIILDMANARSRLGYVPLQKNVPLQFDASNPLVAVLDNQGSYRVRYGNRSVSRLVPQFFDYNDSLVNVNMVIDGVKQQVALGSMLSVNKDFSVEPVEGYRVNIIGLSLAGQQDESGVAVTHAMIAKRFSVDKQATRYRVEFYKDNAYCGMVLVNFSDSVAIDQREPKRPGS